MTIQADQLATGAGPDGAAPRLYTPGQVATMLGLDYRDVLRRIRSGDFRAWPVGGRGAGSRRHYRMTLEQVDAARQLITSGEQPQPEAPGPAPVDPLQQAMEATRRRLSGRTGHRKRY